MDDKTTRRLAARRSGRAWRRPPPSLMVLLLGILLLLGAAWQAFGTGRSQERTVTRVLQGYASVAAWNFEQQATTMMRDIVEPVFHRPLHEVSFQSGRLPPVSPAALVSNRTDLSDCARELIAATRFAARVALNGDEVSATLPLETSTAAVLSAELRSHFRGTSARDRLTGYELIHAFELVDSDVIVVYTTKVVPSDTMLYALVMDPARMKPTFDRLIDAGELLPDVLLGDADPGDLLSLALMMPSGDRVLYGEHAESERTGIRALAKLGGLAALVELKQGAEAHLILGDSPLSSGAFLLAILVLAIGLLIIAFSQIRREYALTRLRSDFVSSVSHELRTPLALQRVFLDMLRLGRVTTDDRRQWCFDNIDRETVRLAHLVENLLHFSRSQQGTMRVHAERTRLAPIIAEIILEFEPLAAATDAAITLRLDPAVSAPVDAPALRQVLMNLLENAVKYAPPGEAIGVALEFESGIARIIVDDTGAGVPDDERDMIFEPYSRGRSTFNTAIAGSGIGLAVVRELVRGHNGRVFVTDAPAGGARFIVELPDARREVASHEADRHAKESADCAVATPLERRHVLAG